MSSHKVWPDKPSDWKELPAFFSQEKIEIGGHVVMWRWAQSYMEELARIATRNAGVVLEIGFGFGVSADVIQQQPIERHVIVEMNADVFARLEDYARTAQRPIEALSGLWQEVVPTLPDESFDGILFDAFPASAEDVEFHFSFFPSAYRLLKKGGVFTYYSSEETDFSSRHLQRLREAGFSHIAKRLCAVDPAPECLYWQSNTIIAPIIVK